MLWRKQNRSGKDGLRTTVYEVIYFSLCFFRYTVEQKGEKSRRFFYMHCKHSFTITITEFMDSNKGKITLYFNVVFRDFLLTLTISR